MLTTLSETETSERGLQLRLAELNSWRLTPTLPHQGWAARCSAMARIAVLEGRFLEDLRASVRPQAAAAPTDADAFGRWFEELIEAGPGQGDALFPWLASHCSLDEMKWFLTQEVAGEAGFEDLTALTQLKFPQGPKLELARNYWDEMGQGNAKGMHGPLLQKLAEFLELTPTLEGTVTEALSLANTMAGLAANRRYAYQSVGALGVIELTAPGRSAATAQGLRRLGVDAKTRLYFSLHAVLDVKHSKAWNTEAIKPLVALDPRNATAIAEGALMRLECGAQCFRRYRDHFGLSEGF